jgi:hypothetical protein
MIPESAIYSLMKEAETKAWIALQGYKFWMFGYHASSWVKYNKLLLEPRPNPFNGLVNFARAAQAPSKKDPVKGVEA